MDKNRKRGPSRKTIYADVCGELREYQAYSKSFVCEQVPCHLLNDAINIGAVPVLRKWKKGWKRFTPALREAIAKAFRAFGFNVTPDNARAFRDRVFREWDFSEREALLRAGYVRF